MSSPFTIEHNYQIQKYNIIEQNIKEINEYRDFQTWLITQVTATRGAACQFPSELPVCPGCSVYNSQAA